MTSTNADEVVLSLSVPDPFRDDLKELVDALRRESIDVQTQTQDVGDAKGTLEVVSELSIALAAITAARGVILQLLAEWLHRPGDRAVHITRIRPDGKKEETDIKAQGMTPKDFAETIASLDRATDTPPRGKKK